MARPNFEDVARQVRTEVEAIPYDHHDGEAAALAVLAKALGVMYDRGLEDGAMVAVKGTLRINGSPIGILTSLTYVIDQGGNYYDATIEELRPAWAAYVPSGGPVDMPACQRPHALEVPLPEGATYRPMTTAAESVRQLAERIETRAKNDLLMAQKLREIL